MTPARWAEVRQLFERLVALPSAERMHVLEAEAAADPELRSEVARLLEADTEADTGIAQRVAPPPGLVAAALHAQREGAGLAGRQVGRWRLERPLGEGGMGSVWLGERSDAGFVQRAAIKLIRGVHPGPSALARFAAEQRILARLSHPNVARLIDGGVSEEGLPFIAIEYVEGCTLREHVELARLDTAATIRLFGEVCTAVAHAHRNLVVHRDLKPSNILVTRDGAVKLLDFGIARLIDDLDGGAPALTASGVRLYTPGYAAPEQLRGEPVGTATDVYALGVLLYELVSGRRPFEVPSLSPVDWERAVLTQEPLPPSRPISTGGAAASETLRLRKLPRAWRGDLDAIVLKAIRREPEQRYASVAEMQADLEALLAGRPVAARRGSRRYRLGKFLRRHALAVGLGSLAVLALLGGLGVALWQAREAAAERDIARREALTAERTTRFLTRVFELADPGEARGDTVTARDLLDRGARSISSELEDEPGAQARLLVALGEAYAGLGLAAPALDLAMRARKAAELDGDPWLATRARLSLASAHVQSGLLAEAEATYREALALAMSDDARSEALRAELELGLATLLTGASRLDEAGPWFEAGMARQVRALGAVEPAIAVPYSSYLHARGRIDEAGEFLQAMLERVRRERADDDPLRAALAGQYAVNRVRAGRSAEAIGLQQEVIEVKRRIYGDTHPSVDVTRHNLAKSLADLGRYTEAESLLVDLVPRLRERHGPAHPRTAASEAALARVLIDSGRAAEALPLWERALTTAVAQWGEADTAVAIVRLGRGRTLAALGRLPEALAELDQALVVYSGLGDGGRGGRSRTLSERARVRLALGEPEAALADAQAALAALPGQGGLAVAYAHAVHAELLHASGAGAEAAAALAAARAAVPPATAESLPELHHLRRVGERIGGAAGSD